MFIKTKKDVKTKYFKQLSTNMNNISFQPMIQEINYQKKKKTQRKHLLEKYMNGDYLTAWELK